MNLMNIPTLIALIAVIVIAVLMIRSTIKKKQTGGCGCGCSSCSGSCPHCITPDLKNEDIKKGDTE